MIEQGMLPSKAAPTLLKQKKSISVPLLFFGAVVSALLGGLAFGVLLQKSQTVACREDPSSFMCEILTVPEDEQARGLAVPNSEEEEHPLARLKPVAVEIGTLALLQAVGVRLLRRVPIVLRRITASGKAARAITAFSGWIERSAAKCLKTVTAFYKKTAASKVVTRTKKIMKEAKYAAKRQAKARKNEEEAEASGVSSH